MVNYFFQEMVKVLGELFIPVDALTLHKLNRRRPMP